MKKRLTAMLLASALVFALAACGGDSATTSAPEGTTPAETGGAASTDATLTLKIGISPAPLPPSSSLTRSPRRPAAL